MNGQPMRDFVVGFQANHVNEVKCKVALKCLPPSPQCENIAKCVEGTYANKPSRNDRDLVCTKDIWNV